MRMNRFVGLFLVTLSVAAFAFAEPPEGKRGRGPGGPPDGHRGGGGPRGGGPPAIIKAIDANSDQKISTEEMENATAALKKLDKNGDGVLTPDEFAHPGHGSRPPRDKDGAERGRGPGRGHGEGRPPRDGKKPQRDGKRPGPEDFFKRFDADKDGKVSKEEAPGRMKENFDKIDKNSDGFADEAELKAFMESMRGKGRPGGGPPRDGKPGERGHHGPPRGPGGPGGFGERFKEIDKDGDGKVSKEEATARVNEMFDKVDANGDGQIEQSEIKKFMEKMHKHRGHGHHGPPRDGKRPPRDGDKPPRGEKSGEEK